jgi:signal transduction histidine kinase
MRRPSVRTLIIFPWVLLTLAAVFLFLSATPQVNNQLVAISVLVMGISIATAYVVANTVVHAVHELRAEAARLARMRSSPVDPQNIDEFHTLRSALTAATDALHTRVEEAELGARRLRAVLESLTEGVVQLTGDARFLHANAAARDLLKLPAGLEGQSVSALIRYAELRMALQQAAQGTSLQATEITVDERQLLISPRRIQFPGGGSIPGAIVGIVDLTQLRKLESVRRDFVANVSHELKTPLTSIRGYTETLLTDSPDPEVQQQFLRTIQANAERLQRIIDDLLDISRLQSGGWQPHTESVDVTALTRDVWSTIDDAGRKCIEFTLAGAERALVKADAGGLRQVLSNILQNAVRHTEDRGHVRVDVCTPGEGSVDPDMIEIVITDDGAGIPRDALPRIFERFFRVDASRRRADGGTGLGLSIVKHLVDRMAGNVTAESELGKGTTIRITLPAADS